MVRDTPFIVGDKNYLGGVDFVCQNIDSFGFLQFLKEFLDLSSFFYSFETSALESILEEVSFHQI